MYFPRSPQAHLLLGSGLLVFALALGVHHAVLLLDLQERGLPLAAEVPLLEERLESLQAQLAYSEEQQTQNDGSLEERLKAFVLPEGIDQDRIVHLFEVLTESLRKSSQLRSFSGLEIGTGADHALSEGTAIRAPVSFHATVTEEGAVSLLSLLELAGSLTVGDVLTPDELSVLTERLDREESTALVGLEQFLQGDLLSDARDPNASEDKVLRSTPSEQFMTLFRGTLHSSALARSRATLRDMGTTLRSEKLWPLPFLTIDSVELKDVGGDWFDFSATISAYASGASF